MICSAKEAKEEVNLERAKEEKLLLIEEEKAMEKLLDEQRAMGKDIKATLGSWIAGAQKRRACMLDGISSNPNELEHGKPG